MTAGDARGAQRLADSAVAAVSPTDYLRLHGDTLVDRATVLNAVGKHDAALADLDEAIALYERKGIISSLETVRRSFETLAATR